LNVLDAARKIKGQVPNIKIHVPNEARRPKPRSRGAGKRGSPNRFQDAVRNAHFRRPCERRN
jgi:hypothetical protein